MPKRGVHIGDVFEVPLQGKRKAFGRFVIANRRIGPLIEIFDLITPSTLEIDLREIVSKPLLFPPVITGIYAAVRTGMWKVIGHVPVVNYEHPKFISTFWDDATGKARLVYI